MTEFLDRYRYYLAGALIVLLAVGSLAWDPPVKIQIEVLRMGPLVQMTWDEVPGAAFYEIQGRTFDGDWATFAITPSGLIGTEIPVGISQFRCRAWFRDGSHGAWSSPTDRLLWLPPRPEPPPAAPPERDRSKDAMNLLEKVEALV